ncbi:MAG: hypothetical protein ACTHNK_01230 [Thermomicrobiales bacterium]|nr:hypothetical protein [Thermomicrobiales bacterium]
MVSAATTTTPEQEAEESESLDANGRLSAIGELRVRAWHLRFLLNHPRGQRQAAIEAELAAVEARLAQAEAGQD